MDLEIVLKCWDWWGEDFRIRMRESVFYFWEVMRDCSIFYWFKYVWGVMSCLMIMVGE